jgi:hypothetical protein
MERDCIIAHGKNKSKESLNKKKLNLSRNQFFILKYNPKIIIQKKKYPLFK